MAGMYLGQNLNAETTEPYFQLASAFIIIGVAFWMLWRTWRGAKMWEFENAEHSHHHHDERRRIETGHGVIELSIFEDGVPPRWRIQQITGQKWKAREVNLVTTRPDGQSYMFGFVDKGDYLESGDEIPEPHQFTVLLKLGHGSHTHDYQFEFSEHDHEHGHSHEHADLMNLSLERYEDAHEKAHAEDIKKRFTNKNVTTGQIVLFGLTGGLIPCPAAITVLLLCLQVKEVALGAVLVLCFSIGLALTLVAVGVAAAIGARKASNKWPWFSEVARKAPYFSGLLIIAVGLYVGFHGWSQLMTQ
jgi:nickel/cobalt exporter